MTQFGQHYYNYDPANRLINYKHFDNSDIIDVEYDYWYDVDGERIGKCRRVTSDEGGVFTLHASPFTNTEEFTFYLRDEEGNVMTEFKSDFCPSPQYYELSNNAFSAKENNFYFGGKITATEKIEGYSSSCP
ncbi:MAG: hypothetical protein WH035_09035, partial [Spirochaetota bacterium]